jgi:hypothetical protein
MGAVTKDAGLYQQLKTEQPKACAAKLNAALSRKKKMKKQLRRRALAVYTVLRSRSRSANRFGDSK